jgi:hypothetical protein
MKALSKWVIVAAVTLLSACATTESMDYAGTADYHVTPVFNDAGDVVAYEARVRNGKEIGHVRLEFKKGGDGTMELNLDEEGVTAFQGQAISAEAVTRMTEAITRAGVAITPEITKAIIEALKPAL